MADVAAAARHVAWTADDAWLRVDSALAGPPRRGAGGPGRAVAPGIVLRDGALEPAADAPVGTDASLPWRLGAEAAYSGAPITRAALVRLGADGASPGDPWADDTRQALVSLLGAGAAMVPVFESLDRYGVVTRFLPEWDSVRSRPQRNAFHRFTVDRHLLECVAQAAELTRQVGRPDLLLVGALLHDLGKGFPGDHTDAGVEVAERVTARMGLSDHDARVVVDLVRHHLLLPAAATSRDLTDPETAASVAEQVGTVETLELLAALTKADSIATGETAWSSWKAELLRELVARVRAVLLGEEQPVDDTAGELVPTLVARAAGGVLVESDGSTLHVVAPDRPGLLATVVGLLVVHGQSVRAAQVWSTDDGVAVEQFDLESRLGAVPDWSRVRDELVEVLSGSRDLAPTVAERSRTYTPRLSAARPAEPRVIVHDGASRSATVVEVRAPDSVGLLYRITGVISACGSDIRHAKVLTLGHEVVDTFYLRDARGEPLSDAEAGEVQDALRSELVADRA
jgi:[protein-PII] uridylyltransferase